MKLVFQDNYYRAKVYQNKVAADKIIVRYRIDSNYQCFDVRLFDPPVYDLINPGFERIDDIGNPPNNWTYTGGVAGYESGTKHTGTYSAKITQTGGAMTYLYQNLTNLNLTNSTNPLNLLRSRTLLYPFVSP